MTCHKQFCSVCQITGMQSQSTSQRCEHTTMFVTRYCGVVMAAHLGNIAIISQWTHTRAPHLVHKGHPSIGQNEVFKWTEYDGLASIAMLRVKFTTARPAQYLRNLRELRFLWCSHFPTSHDHGIQWPRTANRGCIKIG